MTGAALRLARVYTALSSHHGFSFSLSVLRSPLVSPHLLGLSSGVYQIFLQYVSI